MSKFARARNRSNHTNEMFISTISFIIFEMKSYVRMRIINFQTKGSDRNCKCEHTERMKNRMKKRRRNQNVHVKQIFVYSCSLDCNEIETI